MTTQFCPIGFVIPDNIDSASNIYINKTISECALSCMNPPIFTREQQVNIHNYRLTAVILTVVFSLLIVIIWFVDGWKRQQTFVLANGVVICTSFILLAFFTIEGSDRFCVDNTTPVQGSSLSVCSVEAAVFTYNVMFTAFSYSFQSYEVFRKVVLGRREAPNMTPYLVVAFLYPLLMMVLNILFGSLGYDIGYPMCTAKHMSPILFVFTLVPVLVATTIGFVFFAAVVVKLIILIRAPSEGISLTDGAHFTGTSLKYMIFASLYFWTLLVFSMFYIDTESIRNELMLDWGKCALSHYDGTDKESYISICGSYAGNQGLFDRTCFFVAWSQGGFGFFFFYLNLEGWLRSVRGLLRAFKVLPYDAYIELPPTVPSSSSVVI